MHSRRGVLTSGSPGPDGDDAEGDPRRCLGAYYGFTGALAEQIIAVALTTPRAVAAAVADFAHVGCDELLLSPATPISRRSRATGAGKHVAGDRGRPDRTPSLRATCTGVFVGINDTGYRGDTGSFEKPGEGHRGRQRVAGSPAAPGTPE